MLNKYRLLILISTVLIALVYFFPIWQINLNAPQYPEGIGMKIWINKITGSKENDLDNINKLNHYIGMKTIEPETFIEFKIMPYLLLFLILFGIIAAIVNKKFIVILWLVLIGATLSIGLYDFYKWEYDYGHSLNPNAPIKVPNMSYQPPLIGTKQLLNMKTTSSPDIGSYFIILAVILISSTLFINKRKTIKDESI